MEELSSFIEQERLLQLEQANKERDERIKILQQEIKSIKNKIINLLKKQNKKITVSDIDAFLKHQDDDEIKELCEEMYQDGEISFAGNGRYFVLTEGVDEKKETTSTKTEKSEAMDVKSELKKYKEMLDDGLITQEQYDAKSNELLGL